MAITTILTGILLIALGLGGYVGTGSEHVTALIPSFFGLPILICGLLANREAHRAMVMHIAVLLGTLGFLGSVVQFLKGVNGEAMVKTSLGGGGAGRYGADYGDLRRPLHSVFHQSPKGSHESCVDQARTLVSFQRARGGTKNTWSPRNAATMSTTKVRTGEERRFTGTPSGTHRSRTAIR